MLLIASNGTGRIDDHIYLTIVKPKSILILKWAPQPFSKFMKMKVLWNLLVVLVDYS